MQAKSHTMGQRAREGIKNDLHLLNSLTDKRDPTVKKINHIVKKNWGKVIPVCLYQDLYQFIYQGSIDTVPDTGYRISIGEFSTFMKNLWFCS
jgi:hypothetical protein